MSGLQAFATLPSFVPSWPYAWQQPSFFCHPLYAGPDLCAPPLSSGPWPAGVSPTPSGPSVVTDPCCFFHAKGQFGLLKPVSDFLPDLVCPVRTARLECTRSYPVSSMQKINVALMRSMPKRFHHVVENNLAKSRCKGEPCKDSFCGN